MLTKKQLEITLSKLKEVENPSPSLEQYTIPSKLAADILNYARLAGDIEGKKVADFGCGTSRLAIGTALLGAKRTIAIDIDQKVIETAIKNVKIAEKLTKQKIAIEFIHSDIFDWKGNVDTVVQNPPFGIQTEHADRIFLEKALESSKKIYTLHRSYEKSQEFIKKFVEARNGKIKNIVTYKFRIPHMFRFHKKPKVEYDVDLFVIEVE